MSQSNNFISDLFDFSFSKFIAPKIVGTFYILSVFFSGLSAFYTIVNSLRQGTIAVLINLILAPLLFFLYVIFLRILLEVIIAIFRIAENTGRTAENTKYLRQP